MARNEDKAMAFDLYMLGYAQNDIARCVKATAAQISNWAKEGKWEGDRARLKMNKHNAHQNIWDTINYQLEVIERIKTLQRPLLENAKSVKELKDLLVERGDIDALQKLFTTVKEKEMDWESMVKKITNFIEFISETDNELSKKIIPYADQFFMDERRAK